VTCSLSIETEVVAYVSFGSQGLVPHVRGTTQQLARLECKFSSYSSYMYNDFH
jgi:hypothetical protein